MRTSEHLALLARASKLQSVTPEMLQMAQLSAVRLGLDFTTRYEVSVGATRQISEFLDDGQVIFKLTSPWEIVRL
jgi:hypothetical protein